MDVKKIFLGSDPYREGRTFSYVSRENITRNLDRLGIPYTRDADADFDMAIYPSAEDMAAIHPRYRKKSFLSALVIGCDMDDYNDDPKASKFLSDAALTMSRVADILVTNFDSQMRALLRMGIRKEIRVNNPLATYDKDDVLQAEKDAFRSFYRLPKDKTTIISFGFKRDPESFSLLDSLARVFPNYEFLYFGELEREFLHQKMQERLYHHLNIRYLPALPEELYHSALLSADAVFFPQLFLSYPTMIVDFMAHEVPIVAYRPINLPELVNEKTALMPKDFSSLYRDIKDVKTVNRKKEAKQSLARFIL